MHISLAGRLGSGKSTVARLLKSNHGFEVYSTGAIHREIALKRNVSTLEMNRLLTKDLSIDNEIDDAVTKISIEKKNETIVFDSRMAWKFAVNSYKVFINVDPYVAASRVMANPRGNEEVYNDIEEAKAKLIKRSKMENERFKDIYGVDNFDYANYDLVIDSTFASPDDMAAIIYENFLKCSESTDVKKNILMAPTSLYPFAWDRDIDEEALNTFSSMKEHLNSVVSIVVFDGYHFIVTGYHPVLAAIKNKESFINVELIDTEKNPFFKQEENVVATLEKSGISSVHDYESMGDFRYMSYPKHYYGG